MRRIVLWGAPLVLAAVVVTAWFARAPHVSASLYGLLGRQAERIPKFLREASSADGSVIVSSDDAEKARRAARAIAARCARPGLDLPSFGDVPGEALDFLRENRAGLVTPETAAHLKTSEGRAKIARKAVRRLYGSPLPPVLGYDDDPFALTDGFLATLMPRRTVQTDEGYPVLVTNGVTHVLIRWRLEPEIVSDLDRTVTLCESLREECDRAVKDFGGGVLVRFAGAPVHLAESARRCKGEIGALTWFSLAVIAALAVFVFRSLGGFPFLAGSLLVSSLAGALALVTLFREIHVTTLVMGTTVLGLVIDYSFHWLLSDADSKATVKHGLLVSFATTEISLAPLMLATIPVLRQSAVFLGAGLAAALGYVWTAYPVEGLVPSIGRMPKHATPGMRGVGRLAVWMIALAAVLGLPRLSVRTDLTDLYHPSPERIEAERIRARFPTFDLSAIPSFAERQTIAANVARLYAEHGATLAQALGRPALRPAPAPTDILLRPQALLRAILSAWTKDAVRRLACALAVLVAALVLLCRRRAPRVALPVLVALVTVAGALGWTGTSVNLFHLLAAFLLLGMGIDYAVFLQSDDRRAFKPALCSLLTSVAGFGALAFVSFPVVRAFGIVLGVGLPVAFGTALAMGRGRAPDSQSTEQGATPLGLETLFFIYRLFGLRALHFLATGVGLCIWLGSPVVRHRTRTWRRMAAFTHSLTDKFVILSGGRRKPTVVTDGSPDAESFVADVRAGKGVFVLSSHVGTVEVLSALGACSHTFHAWMDIDRTAVFNRFYLKHAKRPRVVIHPIAGFGMGTVFEAGDWLDGGDGLVMAGDRGAGAFRFAAAFDHPVYFVACLDEGGCRYRAVIRRLPPERSEMQSAYERILAELIRAHPDQHFAWET